VPVEFIQEAEGWYAWNPKWGPSIGGAQIRSLRNPNSGNEADKLRVAHLLRDPVYNAKAMYAISKQGTDFTPWSVYNHGTYEQFLDVDYELKTGHSRADDWDV
jgi:hypothetical protein